jgi:putative membrane protein
MSYHFFPTLNAILNATSAVFLVTGYIFIRRKNINVHRASMVAALITSIIFLSCYLFYHYNVGSTRFQGPDWARTLYLIVLIPHTILAAVMVPFIITVVTRAFRGQFAKHRKLARWTFPVWLYVSVTGVIVYFMLYHWFPSR